MRCGWLAARPLELVELRWHVGNLSTWGDREKQKQLVANGAKTKCHVDLHSELTVATLLNLAGVMATAEGQLAGINLYMHLSVLQGFLVGAD